MRQFRQEHTFSIYVEAEDNDQSGVYYFGWTPAEETVYLLDEDEVFLFQTGQANPEELNVISTTSSNYDFAYESAEAFLELYIFPY